WSHVHYHRCSQRSDLKGFRKLVATLEGPSGAQAFDRALDVAAGERPIKIKEFLDTHYLLDDIIGASRAILVPTDGLGQEVVEKYQPTIPVITVEMGVTDPELDAPAVEKEILRIEAGHDPNAFIVGVFGSVFPIKRLRQIYHAFRDVLHIAPSARLLIVGDGPAEYVAELDQLAHDLQIAAAVRRMGHVPVMDAADRKRFHQLLQMCDVVVNLRWPSHKQMSGTLARAIATGKPILITDLPEWSHLPEAFCTRIPIGDAEVPALTNALCAFALDRSLVERHSTAARCYFEQQGALPLMAGRYAQIIDDLARTKPPVIHKTDTAWRTRVNRALVPEDLRAVSMSRLWKALGLPRGNMTDDGGFLPPRVRLVDVVQAIAWDLLEVDGSQPNGDDQVLILGAAAHALPFALTKQGLTVTAASDYLDSDRRYARMLVTPERWTTGDFHPQALRVVPGDLHSIALSDGQLSAIVSLQPLHLLADPDEISELFGVFHRVLRPGGLVIIPAHIALAVAPGQEAAAHQLGLVSGVHLEELSAQYDFVAVQPTSPAPKAPRLLVTPQMKLGQAHLGDLTEAVETPVAITQGIVHSLAVWAYRRGDGPARPGAGTAGRLRARKHRAAAAKADRLLHPTQEITAYRHSQYEALSMDNLNNASLLARLTRFNRLRMLGWDHPLLNRLPAFIGMIVRGIVRLVYLGDTLQAEAEVFDELARVSASSDHNLRRSLERLEESTAAVEAVLREAGQRTQPGGDAGGLTLRLATLSDQVAQLNSERVANREVIERLQARLDALADEVTALNDQPRSAGAPS
ncbi:MAG: glycosyltransferase, partial [Anaerolineales bacterium]|nr:glycosyltransferase [Anaerolineales bacterium]